LWKWITNNYDLCNLPFHGSKKRKMQKITKKNEFFLQKNWFSKTNCLHLIVFKREG